MARSIGSLLESNRMIGSGSKLSGLNPVPGDGLIILTCMDVRIDPLAVLGLLPGSAHVLRNAGGRVTDDVLRSVAVSAKFMGTDQVLIMHHTHCGLTLVRNHEMVDLMADSYEPAQLVSGRWVVPGRNEGAQCARGLDFGTIDDLNVSVSNDVYRMAWHPLIPPFMRIDGVVLDVETGLIRAVPGASRIPSDSARKRTAFVD